MRCACIDVGSNTTALLVADLVDGDLSPVGTRRRFTRLGRGAGPDGISAEKFEAAKEAVTELVAYARLLKADNVCIVATHVVRDAPNGGLLARTIEHHVGLPVEIIDGHDEARFSFIGATGGLHRVTRATMVIDAGGGSTEITGYTPGGGLATASFPVGSAELHSRFLQSDPPTASEVDAARTHVQQAFAELRIVDDCAAALVVGGGASTAREILGGVIDVAGVARMLELATRLTARELAERFQIELNRAILLPAGLTVLGTLSDRLQMALEVGRGGLREGILIDRHLS